MTEYGDHEFEDAYNAYRELTYDPDSSVWQEEWPVPFWPDDEALANYVEPDRLEDLGHA